MRWISGVDGSRKPSWGLAQTEVVANNEHCYIIKNRDQKGRKRGKAEARKRVSRYFVEMHKLATSDCTHAFLCKD